MHISRLLKNHLENYGATVFMTRDDDYDLSKPNALYRKKSDFDNRISYINNNRPDLYISIHLNIFGNSKYRGPQVFYSSINSQNEFLAKKIQEKLNEFTHTKRKTKIITNTYMYDKLNPNGVLIECGFLSNATDRLNLTNAKYQNDFAQIIAKSLVEYFT